MSIRERFAVFVDNLSLNLDKYGLKGIFQKVGNVNDSYMPSKLGRSRKRFGFVRFWSETEAVNNIRRLNGATVRCSRIRVSRARFGKGETMKLKMQPKRLWHVKSLKADQLN